MKITYCQGNIADQVADAIVNAWNCNFIPWFLLLPQGVSRAIRKKAGSKPFLELSLKGPVLPGSALLTGPGKMPCKHLIHVAGINWFWISTKSIIAKATENALRLALKTDCHSIVFPVIGSGTGGINEEEALEIMKQSLGKFQDKDLDVRIVIFRQK